MKTSHPCATESRTIPFDRPSVLFHVLLAPLAALLALKVMMLGILLMRFATADTLLFSSIFEFGLRQAYVSLVNFGLITKLLTPLPALTLTADGIEDRSGAAAGGFIPWTKLVSAQPAELFLHRGVALYIDDPDELLLHSSGFRWCLQQCNNSIFGTPIHIPIDCIKISADDLIDRLYEKIMENKDRRVVDGPMRSGSPYVPREEYLVPYIENPAATRKKSS